LGGAVALEDLQAVGRVWAFAVWAGLLAGGARQSAKRF